MLSLIKRKEKETDEIKSKLCGVKRKKRKKKNPER
jgi:hypothetical protein